MFVGPLVVPVFDRVFLSQRESWPVFGQQDSAEIGMALELNTEHIVRFALHPVSAGPDAGHTGTRIALRKRSLDPESSVVRNGIQVDDQVEFLVFALGP